MDTTRGLQQTHHQQFPAAYGATYGSEQLTSSGLFPVSAFSAFHILRNYNYLIAPHAVPQVDIAKQSSSHQANLISIEKHLPPLDNEEKRHSLTIDIGQSVLGLPQHPFLAQNLLNYSHHLPIPPTSPRSSQMLSPDTILSQTIKRQRGEKKPIPEEQKDDKYFERRRRNNQAAKKSRDARKIREDHIALRATILEHENAILKAQVISLREEASSLRQMLMQKKALDLT